MITPDQSWDNVDAISVRASFTTQSPVHTSPTVERINAGKPPRSECTVGTGSPVTRMSKDGGMFPLFCSRSSVRKRKTPWSHELVLSP